jgi:hypothetical protein
MVNHSKIMVNEEHGQARIALQFTHRVDDLRLNRDVNRRNGFWHQIRRRHH